ncbi:50S ribosomal protein L25/general stress protein Ctc [Dethiobacter alkaliphilus]|uniref:50S ribosomal protein L25/general stress protein Ctc n=1 Tax=Dethiobacter alkaliphilus TaxID=427926 RepID=UPI002225BD23|nr:50S ribosomal protein L25/general stress protein Ctc [Dethiobacter alkaliphilus]MCW3489123.1 50S ribosomal protein L25/general stress protein Ctc [Dethiobacter alkaliphilus]
MERVQVQAVPREKVTKSQLKELRNSGMVPGIVYGQKDDAVAIAVDSKDIISILQSAAGTNSLVDLAVEGNKETVIIKELVEDIFIQDRFTHVDFLRISLKDKLEVQVPVIFTGDAVGVKEGGTLQPLLREVSLKCLPTEIPESIELDISNLSVGETLTVGDLTVPASAELLNEADEAVVSVAAPRMAEEAAEEGEEGSEAAEAAPEGADQEAAE